MNSAVIEYFNRFAKSKPDRPEKFFTQYNLGQYTDKLPYIFGVESFCIRLFLALINQENICIYSDYDTDAVTATATMYWGLVSLGFSEALIDFYAPDRFTEGYGMNTEAVEMLAQKYDLLISVDCGINSVEEAKIVKKIGHCDLIITDHHHLRGEVPNCVSVINPRLAKYYFENPDILTNKQGIDLDNPKLDPKLKINIQEWLEKTKKNPNLYSTKPQHFLSESVTGVGVAWFCLVWFAYFLQEIQPKKLDTSVSKLNLLLPFVAIGTIADCQSVLEPTNRLLVRAGLQLFQKNQLPFLGLNQLLDQTKLSEQITQNYKLTSQDLGYTLSPILNSSGRLSHAKLSIDTLLSKNTESAQDLARELIQTNQDRKQMIKDIIQELEESASEQFLSGQKIIWIEGNWSKGVVGLLASRLVNKYNLPTVIISVEGSETVVASLRAPEGYHLPNAMNVSPDLFEKFGGHPGAAGFSTNWVNLAKIKDSMSQALSKQAENLSVEKDYFFPEWVDTENLPSGLKTQGSKKNLLWLKKNDINSVLLTEIWSLDPFGQDFPVPSLVFQLNFKDINLSWMGKEQNHLKITFNRNQSLTYFRVSSEEKTQILNSINTDSCFWVEAKLSQNSWNGQTTNTLITEKMYF